MTARGRNRITDNPQQKLCVCYFGTYRANYSRNQIMIAGLRRAGVEVVECHEILWQGIEDRVQVVTGGWSQPKFWGRLWRAYLSLLRAYKKVGPYEVLVLGYPGLLDVFLGRLLSGLRRKPLVWDVFMSVYLVAMERELDAYSRFSVSLLRTLEGIALRIPDMLIQDTAEYVAWLQNTYRVSTKKFRLVPTGADDSIFQPLVQTAVNDGLFRVIYYGSFIPNHGIEHMIEAAKWLTDQKDIHFEFIGNGPEREKAILLAQKYSLTNVTFTQWLDKEALGKRVSQADVCLGAFGCTPQSLMTVQNKIYEAMAMRKALISGDSPAVRQAFQHGEEIYLCRRENGKALAEGILELRDKPELRACIAANGHQRFVQEYNLENIGKRFAACLHEAVR